MKLLDAVRGGEWPSSTALAALMAGTVSLPTVGCRAAAPVVLRNPLQQQDQLDAGSSTLKPMASMHSSCTSAVDALLRTQAAAAAH